MNIGWSVWGAVRRSLIKIGIFAENIAYDISDGKYPSNHFAKRAKPVDVGSSVKIIERNKASVTIAKYDKDGNICDDFRILSTTDFHFDTDGDLNARTCEQFCRRIEDNKPDLVVLTGDIIQGKYQQVDAVKFADMMDKTGVYWCYTFGNHETREEKGFYKWLILKSLAKGKKSLCLHGLPELFGFGNYHIDVLGSNEKPKLSVFLLDSGRDVREEYTAQYGLDKDFRSYDFLKKEQIDWYEKEIKALQTENKDILSMMFMHIALPEFGEVFDGSDETGYVPSGRAEVLCGDQFEGVGCAKFNSGMFDRILALGSTKAVFAGHDHVNDWIAVYKGIHLIYSLHGGYNPYHMGDKFGAPESEWKQGVTVTDIHSDGTFDIKQDYNRNH